MSRRKPDWFVHVDRGIIDSNRTHKTARPPVTIRRGKHGKSTKALEVALPAGSRVVYAPETGEPILPCGARLVIICPEEPLVIR